MKDELIFPIIGAEAKLPIYVVGVGCLLNQHHIDRSNGFPHFQVIYCTSGSGILKVHEDKYLVTTQQVFVLYPDEKHEYYPAEEPWETHWVIMDGDQVQNIFRTLGFTKSMVVYLHNSFGLNELWRQIMVEAKAQYSENGYKCSALAYSFMIALKDMTSVELPVIKDKKMSKLSNVLKYIDKNFCENITIDELADIIAVSPQYLCRLFNAYLNIRPFEYITKRRIQEAKILLIESKLTETEISSSCGFNSLSYFCALFKKYEFITPTEFRYMHCK